jgi:hypothetical protein
MRKLKINIR